MKGTAPRRVDAVLFDLDGTLVDSAHDLAGAANELRGAQGLGPLPFEALRPMVGTGARGMLREALGIGPGDPGYETMRVDFLRRYEVRLLRLTRVFAAMEPVLLALERQALRWGVVTNKIERYAAPLVAGLGLKARCAVLICGDTTAQTKPHPRPLLEAALRLDVAPQRCVYVGDDHRDVIAGRSAQMATLAAAWGYLGRGEPIEQWQADAVLRQPAELLNWLGMS